MCVEAAGVIAGRIYSRTVIAPDDPLGRQARRYLDRGGYEFTLTGTGTWYLDSVDHALANGTSE